MTRGFTLLYRGEDLEDTLSHTQHCIEYLRVTLMCHADTALEGGEFVDSAHVAQGMGTVYTCKKWDEVLSWIMHTHYQHKAQEREETGHLSLFYMNIYALQCYYVSAVSSRALPSDICMRRHFKA